MSIIRNFVLRLLKLIYLNPMENFEGSRDATESQEKIDKFIGSFEGVRFKNSDGKIINLTITAGEVQDYSDLGLEKEYPYHIGFEGYLGRDPISPKLGNYCDLIINPTDKKISLVYVSLQDKDLRGKGIYPQLIRFIGDHFPEGFALRATIENEKTMGMASKLLDDFEAGTVSEDAVKTKMLKSGMLKITTDAGFNDIEVGFDHGDVVVSSKKNPDTSDISIGIREEELE